MPEALRVDRQNFCTIAPGSAEDFMRTFFWLDEDSPGAIRLFQLVATSRAKSLRYRCQYNDGDDWPAQPPVGMYFNYGLAGRVHVEWLLRPGVTPGKSPGDEYFEWKLNWPRTCDDSKEPSIPWRKNEKDKQKTALLNLSFSRAVLLVPLGLFS